MATTIRTTVALGNLWGDSDLTGIDQAASERAYVERLEATLAAAYPGAEITVDAQRVSGVREGTMVWPAGADMPDEAEAERVDELAGQVWQAWLESGLVETAPAAGR